MSKMEMTNRLIIMGCVSEKSRDFLMRKNAQDLLKLYIYLVGKKNGVKQKNGKEKENNSHIHNQWT